MGKHVARRKAQVETEDLTKVRREAVLGFAKSHGLVGVEKDARISGRVSRRLLAAAKKHSGIASDSALIEYALAGVVADDDGFVEGIYARRGSVPDDVDLDV